MSRDLTFENFLKELGMRAAAAAVVFGVFFGLAYVDRTGLLGHSDLLGSPASFFAAAFLLIGAASLVWIAVRRER